MEQVLRLLARSQRRRTPSASPAGGSPAGGTPPAGSGRAGGSRPADSGLAGGSQPAEAGGEGAEVSATAAEASLASAPELERSDSTVSRRTDDDVVDPADVFVAHSWRMRASRNLDDFFR